jgi:hypothetical protein
MQIPLFQERKRGGMRVRRHEQIVNWTLQNLDLFMLALPWEPSIRRLLQVCAFDGIPAALVPNENAQVNFIDILVITKFRMGNELKNASVVIEVKTRDKNDPIEEVLAQIHRYEHLISLDHNQKKYSLDSEWKLPSIALVEEFATKDFDEMFAAAGIMLVRLEEITQKLRFLRAINQ